MSGRRSAPPPANIEAAFAAMSPQPLPFGGGINFQCNGKQVSLTASVCSTGALEATLDQSGNPVGAYTPLDASAVEKLGWAEATPPQGPPERPDPGPAADPSA